MYNKNSCSPISKKYSDNKFSCLNIKLIKKLAKILNIKINDNLKLTHDNISKHIKKITTCKQEACWITINDIIINLNKKELNEFRDMFKPRMPKSWEKNNNEWLNTLDIENVLNQYQKIDKKLYFYGALPSDYYNKSVCDIYKLCEIKIAEHIKNKIEKIAIVFNTDESDKSGKHWVSIYIDLKGINSGYPAIYYFDSVGNKPNKNIKMFISKVRKQKKMNYYYNDIPHQAKNTECGIYSLHFIVYMIKRGNFNKYIKNIKNDEYMQTFRKFFYNKL